MNDAADNLGDCSGIQDHTCRNGRSKICRHRVSGLWHPREKLWEGLQRWGKRHSHSEYLRFCIQCRKTLGVTGVCFTPPNPHSPNSKCQTYVTGEGLQTRAKGLRFKS